MSDQPTLLTFLQFSECHPAFTAGGLRWLRFNQESNGFAGGVGVPGRDREHERNERDGEDELAHGVRW